MSHKQNSIDLAINKVVYLAAEAWADDYADYKFPQALQKYYFKGTIELVYPDRSWKVRFEVDDAVLDAKEKFFNEWRLSLSEVAVREIITANDLEEYAPNVEDSEEEVEPEEKDDNKDKVSKRGRPKGRHSKTAIQLESSDVEFEEVDQYDDDEVDNEVEDENLQYKDFKEVDEYVEREVNDFAQLERGAPKPLSRFEGFSPYRLFLDLFLPIVKWTVECTNLHIVESGIKVKELSVGELLRFLGVYMYMGLNKLPALSFYWHYGSLEGFIKVANWKDKGMTFTRFKEIKSVMRFEKYDDIDETIRSDDKAWKIRSIFSSSSMSFPACVAIRRAM